MDDSLAYLLTWTTYGTWLRGDPRGWVMKGQGEQTPDALLNQFVKTKLAEPPCILNQEQRDRVNATIEKHCDIKGWKLWAVNCRSNHVHVVVSGTAPPELMVQQFKSWSTRALKELGETDRKNWWTPQGSQKYLWDEAALEQAIIYVQEAQDRKARDQVSPEIPAPLARRGDDESS